MHLFDTKEDPSASEKKTDMKEGGKPSMLFYMIFPVIAAGCTVAMDLQREKVDNGWLLFCLAISFFVQLTEKGADGLAALICGLCTPLLVLGWLFLFRMLGAGDIKLLCVMGSILGPGKILSCIFYSFLIGAVISAALMISNGMICQRIQYLLCYVCDFLKTGEKKSYRKSGMPLENFHFTVPIFLSALLYAGGIY